MTEHQRRLWQEMISLIDSYSQGRIDFDALVGRLEGALDAGEFSDPDLVRRWYDVWTPLEVHRAAERLKVEKNEIPVNIASMRAFLVKELPTLS